MRTIAEGTGIALATVHRYLLSLKESGDLNILRSCNEDKETYPDIFPRDLKIQGVAVCVMHRLKKRM